MLLVSVMCVCITNSSFVIFSQNTSIFVIKNESPIYVIDTIELFEWYTDIEK